MSIGPDIRAKFKNIFDEKAPGPKSNLENFHLEQALRLIAEGDVNRENKPLGRQKLANILGLGGGSIRSLLKIMQNEGLIKTSKMGNELSKKGEKLLKELKKQIPYSEIKIDSAKDITNSDINFALLIKNCSGKISSGMTQRDAAMKIGASGAITIIFKDGKYSIPAIPNFNDLNAQYPKFIDELKTHFSIETNDVIIIGTSDKPISAKAGVWAATYSLI